MAVLSKQDKSDNRTNLWTFLIYPGDSAPDNYLEIIRSWHIPAAVSPVHAPELNDIGHDSGEDKIHVHVILYFGTGQKKSYDQINEFAKYLNGTRIFPVQSRNGLVRYLIHYDDPDKQQVDLSDGHQWTEDDISFFAGFEVGDAFGSFIKDEEYYKYIEDLIIDHKIINMADLVITLKDFNCFSELTFLRRHTYYFDRVMDGMYRRLKKVKATVDF